MASLLFYENPVPLDKKAHRKLRVKLADADFAFAENINSVILAEVEFQPAARDYPIMFARANDGRIVPVALLGLRRDENLFVRSGRWRSGCYVPAFVRRYPFIPAETGSDQLTVCIDERYRGFGPEGGEPLFDEQGEPSALLNRAIALMQSYQAEWKRTEEFTRSLSSLELFKDVSIRVQMKDGTPLELSGALTVDEAKLAGLTQESLWSLHSAGHLAAIYAHLLSLGNLALMIDLLAVRLLAGRPGAVQPERASEPATT
jgi:hypothetical protein